MFFLPHLLPHLDVILLQMTGEFTNSFNVEWSFAPEDEVNIRQFKIRWCEHPSCYTFKRRRRFVRQAETVEWIERYRPANSRRSFTLSVHTNPVYAFQIIAEAVSMDVPRPSLFLNSGKSISLKLLSKINYLIKCCPYFKGF